MAQNKTLKLNSRQRKSLRNSNEINELSDSDREENIRSLWRKHVEETIDRVADCNYEISNYDEEQEEARHVDEVIDRVANRNYKVPNWKGCEMSWKEYELKETNEEQRQETDQIVDLLMKRGYDLTTAFSIASVGIEMAMLRLIILIK